ncbi:MAG TPA: hypothetical protein VHE35_31385 [Kofleriaceae bacterium]|nr:hypothetical protein [Kofleriaceae bacterium]
MMRSWSVMVVLATAVASGACGGVKIPQHSGYKGTHPEPWKKPKELKLTEKDGKYTGKAEDSLDYGAYKRARWYKITLPGPGKLDLDLEITPGGDAEDTDVGFEVLSPNYDVISPTDKDADDTNEQKKTRSLADLPEGDYLVHLYLNGRLDSADVELKATFTRGEAVWKSDFPNQVAFVGELAAIPPFDDTPVKAPPPPKPHHGGGSPRPPKPEPEAPVDPSAPKPVAASITNVEPAGSGARITIGAGTNAGVADGWKGSINGVKGSGFVVSGCGAVTCQATVKVSADEASASGKVVLKAP